MNQGAPYWLESAAWVVAGVIVDRLVVFVVARRAEVRGGEPRNPPLLMFCVVMVGLVTVAGFLFDISTRLRSERYQSCQAQVNDQLRDVAATDRSALDKFVKSISADLALPDGGLLIKGEVDKYLRVRNDTDAARSRVADTDCKP